MNLSDVKKAIDKIRQLGKLPKVIKMNKKTYDLLEDYLKQYVVKTFKTERFKTEFLIYIGVRPIAKLYGLRIVRDETVPDDGVVVVY